MTTYQDLQENSKSQKLLSDFLISALDDYKLSKVYRNAVEAAEYYSNRNPTISRYQKLLYTISGRAVPDNYSANFKLASNVYFRFVTQTVQYLLGNGVRFSDDRTKKLLGGEDFDTKLQKALTLALNGGVAFGFMNYDRVEIFGADEFIPLYDEESGRLCAGIRFWQLDRDKPLRVTLYEDDGYTEFIKRGSGDVEVYKEKTPYKLKYTIEAGGSEELCGGENYCSLPIVPLHSPRKQSSIVGFKQQIDCHDLIMSGYANDIDDASMIYWTISNAGGMDDIDLAKFVQHMKTVKAAVVEDDGAKAEAHTPSLPYQSREAILQHLESEMYRDFMVLNYDSLASSTRTATAIKAAYEPMNLFSNLLETSVKEFILGLLKLLGVEDSPRFQRESISNEYERAKTVQTRVSTVLMLRELYGDERVKEMVDEIMNLDT